VIPQWRDTHSTSLTTASVAETSRLRADKALGEFIGGPEEAQLLEVSGQAFGRHDTATLTTSSRLDSCAFQQRFENGPGFKNIARDLLRRTRMFCIVCIDHFDGIGNLGERLEGK